MRASDLDPTAAGLRARPRWRGLLGEEYLVDTVDDTIAGEVVCRLDDGSDRAPAVVDDHVVLAGGDEKLGGGVAPEQRRIGRGADRARASAAKTAPGRSSTW